MGTNLVERDEAKAAFPVVQQGPEFEILQAEYFAIVRAWGPCHQFQHPLHGSDFATALIAQAGFPADGQQGIPSGRIDRLDSAVQENRHFSKVIESFLLFWKHNLRGGPKSGE